MPATGCAWLRRLVRCTPADAKGRQQAPFLLLLLCATHGSVHFDERPAQAQQAARGLAHLGDKGRVPDAVVRPQDVHLPHRTQ